MHKGQSRFAQSARVFSLICLAHCALTPLLLMLSPLGAIAFIHEKYIWIEYVLVGISFLISLRSGLHSYRKHHQKILPMLVLGIAFICFLGHFTFEKKGEKYFILALCLMVIAQLYNYVLCKKSDEEHRGCSHQRESIHR